jgi:hypothetical protein
MTCREVLRLASVARTNETPRRPSSDGLVGLHQGARSETKMGVYIIRAASLAPRTAATATRRARHTIGIREAAQRPSSMAPETASAGPATHASPRVEITRLRGGRCGGPLWWAAVRRTPWVCALVIRRSGKIYGTLGRHGTPRKGHRMWEAHPLLTSLQCWTGFLLRALRVNEACMIPAACLPRLWRGGGRRCECSGGARGASDAEKDALARRRWTRLGCAEWWRAKRWSWGE